MRGRQLAFSMLVGLTWNVGEKAESPARSQGRHLSLAPPSSRAKPGYCRGVFALLSVFLSQKSPFFQSLSASVV